MTWVPPISVEKGDFLRQTFPASIEYDCTIMPSNVNLLHTQSEEAMLDGLDQIDWKHVGYHIWGKSDDYLGEIPQKIRDLRSSDESQQGRAMDHLFGHEEAFGVICDTTPHIIPFVMELVSYADTPRRALLLDYLLKVGDTILVSEHLSVDEMRLYVRAHDSIAKGIDVLIHLLEDDDREVQLSVVGLLGNLTGEAERLLPEFFWRFDTSRDEEVQLRLLAGIKTLLANLDEWKQSHVKEEYAPILRDIVDISPSPTIQLAAARASVETIIPNRQDKNILSTKVVTLLSEEFIQRSFQPAGREDTAQLDHSTSLVRDLSLLGYEPLLEIFKNSPLDVVQTHLIVRGLLAAILTPSENRIYWRTNPGHTNQGIYYLQAHRTSSPSAASGSGDYRVFTRDDYNAKFFKRILEGVVERQEVWDLPTNMFSFFFGLPDSREELTALLNSRSFSWRA
jgi:hypothetical protein